MKWSFTGVGLIVFGLIGLTIILLFEQITTSNENDYYLLKEITNAAMVDSIDIAYYRETGDLKIVREKFVENFTRRYSESTLFIGTSYTISFYDIMEVPPKVTIVIDTGLGQYRIFNDVDKSIFKAAANVNMNSILGWEKDGEKYSFLDPENPLE